jgi:CRP-like cAMP-binding protein
VSDYELKRFELLADLAGDELETVEELLEPLHFEAGEQLFREGQEAEGLLLLHDGRLRVESSRWSKLEEIEAGAVVGSLALVGVGAREVTAVAVEPSCALLLSRTAFHRLAEDAPRTAGRILESLVRELAGTLRGGLEHLA